MPAQKGGIHLIVGRNELSRLSRRFAFVAIFAIFAAACGGSSGTTAVTFKGTKMVGLSIALTGQSNLYGHAISQALNLAADDINAKGGVNGYKIQMDILDDATTVPKAVSNIQQLILQDQVVAMIGAVSSGQCLGESPISKQNKVIFIAATCNSYQLTLEPDVVNPYFVSVVPNTFMEGTSAGNIAAKLGAKKIFIVSPNYLFGTSETNAFVASLKKQATGLTFNDPSTWYVPFPTNPSWTSTINAIQSFHPDLVYSNIFSQDQVNFITQALAVDPQFFTKYPMETLSSIDDFNALGSKYPVGMHVYMRAPFFTLTNPKLDAFVKEYHDKYNEYPSDWSVMDTDAINMWASAANKAGTFDSDKVMAQILGKTFPSLRGYNYTIRAADHQANVGETIGTTVDSAGKYPFVVLKDSTNLTGDQILMPTNLMQEMLDGKCEKGGNPTTANFALCPSWSG
jgi:branched-chain amino acid transport system substrate-binding protein